MRVALENFNKSGGRLSPRGRADGRILRALLIALRVVVGAVLLHLSGMSVLASEIGARVADDCCTDCPIEQNGRECPPACPVCHCAHGNVALPAASENTAASLAPAERSISITPYEASVSSAPQLPGIYRPPRAISSSA